MENEELYQKIKHKDRHLLVFFLSVAALFSMMISISNPKNPEFSLSCVVGFTLMSLYVQYKIFIIEKKDKTLKH